MNLHTIPAHSKPDRQAAVHALYVRRRRMKTPSQSGYFKTDGIVMFARTLEKIRLHHQGSLPGDYNLGIGLDGRVCRFLCINYEDLKNQVIRDKTDADILEWCYQNGRKPNEEEKLIFNHFMEKRGWRDDITEWVVEHKKKFGIEDRDYIQTAFDVHDYDEGRKPRFEQSAGDNSRG